MAYLIGCIYVYDMYIGLQLLFSRYFFFQLMLWHGDSNEYQELHLVGRAYDYVSLSICWAYRKQEDDDHDDDGSIERSQLYAMSSKKKYTQKKKKKIKDGEKNETEKKKIKQNRGNDEREKKTHRQAKKLK